MRTSKPYLEELKQEILTLIQEKGDTPVLFDCPTCQHKTLALRLMSDKNTNYENRQCLVCGNKFEPSYKEKTE